MTDEPVAPGGVVGILGGGQLGKMMAMAAARLGLRAHIYAPPGDNPAMDVAAHATAAAYDDLEALARFAQAVDVVTFEFENIPADALSALEARVRVAPGRKALEISQDRLSEKRFLNELGIATAPYAPVDSRADLDTLPFDGRAILKTRRFGYDGKGQARLAQGHGASDRDGAWEDLGGAPAIAEGFIGFEREISVIAARAVDGSIRAYEPGENEHRAGILHTTTLPARLETGLADQAKAVTGQILAALDYVGVIGVEFFVLPDAENAARLVVNEFAPRVHNSGHWTIEACAVSQFEQHIRAVCGWPLADPTRHSDVRMTNLIGSDVADWQALAARADAALHLYGKAQIREARKMGHLTELLGPARKDA
ncbi:MAG: 5-(carboxyamino)imidazole ribonucleotide synthase [Neomegalonema sp.]|nr:5-(carboxyamino)imidazole ribonucleotide synthase [Neomegalonema sp.]